MADTLRAIALTTLAIVLVPGPSQAQELRLDEAVRSLADPLVFLDPSLATAAVPQSPVDIEAWAAHVGGWVEPLPGGARMIHGPAARPLGGRRGAPVSVQGGDSRQLLLEIARAGQLKWIGDEALPASLPPLQLRQLPAHLALALVSELAGVDSWQDPGGTWRTAPRRSVSVDRLQGPLGEVAAEVARAGGLDLVVAPGYETRAVSVDVEGRPARELLESLASACGLKVTGGRCLLLGPGPGFTPAPPPDGPRAPGVFAAGLPLGELLESLASTAPIPLHVAPAVAASKVWVTTPPLPWEQTLRLLADAAGAQLEWTDAAARVTPLPAVTRSGRGPLREALDDLASAGGIDLLVGPGVEGEITLELSQASWRDALEAVVSAAGLSLQSRAADQALVTRRSSPPQSLSGAPTAREFVARGVVATVWFSALAVESGLPLDVPPELPGQVDFRAGGISAGEAAALSAWGGDYGLKQSPAGRWALVAPRARGKVYRSLPPADPELQALLLHLRLAVRRGFPRRAERALSLARGWSKARTTAAPAPPSETEGLEVRLRQLAEAIEGGRDTAPLLADLETSLRDGGESASLTFRRLSLRWERLLADGPETVRGLREIRLRVDGEASLERMRRELEAGHAVEVQAVYRRVLAYVADARSQGWEDLQEQVSALEAEAEAIWERTRPLLALQGLPIELTASITPGGGRLGVAIINGHPLRDGDPVLDPKGNPVPGLSLVTVESGGVRLAYRGREVVRPVGK